MVGCDPLCCQHGSSPNTAPSVTGATLDRHAAAAAARRRRQCARTCSRVAEEVAGQRGRHDALQPLQQLHLRWLTEMRHGRVQVRRGGRARRLAAHPSAGSAAAGAGWLTMGLLAGSRFCCAMITSPAWRRTASTTRGWQCPVLSTPAAAGVRRRQFRAGSVRPSSLHAAARSAGSARWLASFVSPIPDAKSRWRRPSVVHT